MINKETRIFHAHAQDPCALHALPRSFHAQARTATLILPCPLSGHTQLSKHNPYHEAVNELTQLSPTLTFPKKKYRAREAS